MKQVTKIEIRVELEDGRRTETVWVRQEKILELMHSDDLGPTLRAMVDHLPDEKVPS